MFDGARPQFDSGVPRLRRSLPGVFLLSNLAIAQPLFDVMGRHAEFFVAHHATSGTIALGSVALSIGIPLTLTGLLVGGGTQLASFGSFLAYEGDSLLGGRAVVEAIGKRHVTLAYDDRQVRVELPPFRSRNNPRSSDSADAEDGDSDAEVEAPAPDGPADMAEMDGSNNE